MGMASHLTSNAVFKLLHGLMVWDCWLQKTYERYFCRAD